MANNYVVYTEIWEGSKVERWYYGTYDRATANAVAMELNFQDTSYYHCVCSMEEARRAEVLNLPR